MGWGESLAPSAEMVRRNEQRRAADTLAHAVRQFLTRPTTGNSERLADALDRYDTIADPTPVIAQPRSLRDRLVTQPPTRLSAPSVTGNPILHLELLDDTAHMTGTDRAYA